MAITGESFCVSAYNGFFLNLKNAAAFGAAKFFATSLIFLGKLAITLLNVYTCYLLVGSMLEASDFVAPCVVVGILTWFTTEIWLTIFDQAILGIMTAYAVDYDLNNGEPIRGPETFGNKRKVFEEGHAAQEAEKQGNTMV